MSFSFLHLVEWFDLPAVSFLRERKIAPSFQATILRKTIVKRKGNVLKRALSIHFCLLIIFILFSSTQSYSSHFVNLATNICESCLFSISTHLLPQAIEVKEEKNL
jgi:hypothetical protein